MTMQQWNHITTLKGNCGKNHESHLKFKNISHAMVLVSGMWVPQLTQNMTLPCIEGVRFVLILTDVVWGGMSSFSSPRSNRRASYMFATFSSILFTTTDWKEYRENMYSTVSDTVAPSSTETTEEGKPRWLNLYATATHWNNSGSK